MAWVSPRTYVAAAVLTAAQLNETRDSLKAIGDAWTSYTPAWTSSGTAPALGNGTLTGRSVQAGKLVHYKIDFAAGSTSTYGTGTYSFSIPITASALSYYPIGSAVVRDFTGGLYLAVPYIATGTTIQLLHQSAAGAGASVAATSPFTFAVSDEVHIIGTYEAA